MIASLLAIRVLNRHYAAPSLQPHPREPSFSGQTAHFTHHSLPFSPPAPPEAADKGGNWPIVASGFWPCKTALLHRLSRQFGRCPSISAFRFSHEHMMCSCASAASAGLRLFHTPRRASQRCLWHSLHCPNGMALPYWAQTPDRSGLCHQYGLFVCSGRVGVEGSWRGARGPEPDDLSGGEGPRLPGWLRSILQHSYRDIRGLCSA